MLLGVANISGSVELTGKVELEASTGSLRSAVQFFQLYGIRVIDRDRQCVANEQIWHCGKSAYQTLLNHIDEESLMCVLLSAGDGPDADPPAAECFVGNHSVNAQLVAEGWTLTAVDLLSPYG